MKSLNATAFRLFIFFQDRIYYIRDEDHLRFGFGDEKQETGALTRFGLFSEKRTEKTVPSEQTNI